MDIIGRSSSLITLGSKGLKVNRLGCGSQKERSREVQFEKETIYMTGGE